MSATNKGAVMNAFVKYVSVSLIVILMSVISINAATLGERYAGLTFGAYRPGDEFIRSIDEIGVNYGAQLRLPIVKHVDFYAIVSQTELEGDYLFPLGPEYNYATLLFDCEMESLTASAQLHFSILPDSVVNPFLGVGVVYADTSIDATTFGVTGSLEGDGVGAGVMLGAEFNLTDVFSIVPAVLYVSEIFEETSPELAMSYKYGDDFGANLSINCWADIILLQLSGAYYFETEDAQANVSASIRF